MKKNEYLENKVKCNAEIEEILRSQIAELELKLNAFKKSAQTTQNIIDSQRISSKAAIGLDYSKKAGKQHVSIPATRVFVSEKVPYVIKDVETSVLSLFFSFSAGRFQKGSYSSGAGSSYPSGSGSRGG